MNTTPTPQHLEIGDVVDTLEGKGFAINMDQVNNQRLHPPATSVLLFPSVIPRPALKPVPLPRVHPTKERKTVGSRGARFVELAPPTPVSTFDPV